MSKQFLLKILCIGCILAFIGGCAPTATTDSGRVPVTYISEAEDLTALEQTELLFAQAQLLDQQGEEMLEVAILFAKSGSLQRSTETRALVNSDLLTDQLFIEYTFLGIELNMQADDPSAALSNIEDPRFLQLQSYLGRQYQNRLLSIRADIYTELGDSIASLRNTIALATLLENKSDISNVHNKIWRQLARQPFNTLNQYSMDSDPILAGWCELAANGRRYQNNKEAQFFYYFSTVGVIENSFGDDLLIYPNPTDGNLSIDLGMTHKSASLRVTDLNGKLMQSNSYNNSQMLDLKLEGPAGVYLLTVESGENKAVIRLLKE